MINTTQTQQNLAPKYFPKINYSKILTPAKREKASIIFTQKLQKIAMLDFKTHEPQQVIDDLHSQITNVLYETATDTYGISTPSSSTSTTPKNQQKSHSPYQTDFQKTLRQAKHHTNKKLHSNIDPETIPTILNSARSTFRNLFRSADPLYSTPAAPLPHVSIPSPPDNFIFTSRDDIYNLINIHQIHKSPGPDNISINILKILNDSTEIAAILASFFNACFENAVIPQPWLQFNTILIPKNNQPDSPSLLDFRPIGISSILRVLYEKTIHRHLQPLVKLHPTQQGFQKRRSTTCNLAWAHNTASADTRSLFIDFYKAFDTVDIPILLSKISKILLGLQPPLTTSPQNLLLQHAIHQLFATTFTRIKLKEHSSRFIKRTRGIPQGCPLGPLLFNIYTTDLAELLDELLPRTNETNPSSSMADDFAVRVKTDQALQDAFNLIYQWSDINRISLQPSKCVTINYHGPALLYNGTRIPRKEFTRYLGLPIGFAGPQFFNYFLGKIQQARRRFTTLQQATASTRWSPEHRRLLYIYLIRSQWEYSLPLARTILQQNELNQLASSATILINNICHWILQPFNIPSSLIQNNKLNRQLLQIPSFLERLDYLLASMSFKPPLLIPSPFCPLTRALKNNAITRLYYESINNDDSLDFYTFARQHLKSRAIQELQHPIAIIATPPHSIANVLKNRDIQPYRQLQLIIWQLTATKGNKFIYRYLARNDLNSAYIALTQPTAHNPTSTEQDI
jgi:hypothetical protein